MLTAKPCNLRFEIYVKKTWYEKIEELRKCKYSAPSTTQYAADAIEQLIKERDTAVKCIEDIETYLQMGSAKYIDKTIKEWRGVQE